MKSFELEERDSRTKTVTGFVLKGRDLRTQTVTRAVPKKREQTVRPRQPLYFKKVALKTKTKTIALQQVCRKTRYYGVINQVFAFLSF